MFSCRGHGRANTIREILCENVLNEFLDDCSFISRDTTECLSPRSIDFGEVECRCLRIYFWRFPNKRKKCAAKNLNNFSKKYCSAHHWTSLTPAESPAKSQRVLPLVEVSEPFAGLVCLGVFTRKQSQRPFQRNCQNFGGIEGGQEFSGHVLHVFQSTLDGLRSGLATDRRQPYRCHGNQQEYKRDGFVLRHSCE